VLDKSFLVSWRLILLSVGIIHERRCIVLSSWISDICNTNSGVLSCGFPQLFIMFYYLLLFLCIITCYYGNKFSVGDLVLKWYRTHEDKGKHTKFQSLWIGPFIVHKKLVQHTYHLQSLHGRIESFLIKGQDLKTLFSVMI